MRRVHPAYRLRRSYALVEGAIDDRERGRVKQVVAGAAIESRETVEEVRSGLHGWK